MVETPVIRTVSIRKELTKLVIPIFIETLLIMMLGAVDTIMLSQYSDESVAAVGVVNQIVMFAFLIFEVINIGTSVLCSQYLGAGAGGRSIVAAEPGGGGIGQSYPAFRSSHAVGLDGPPSGVVEVWYRIHGDCGSFRLLSGAFDYGIGFAS
jgi:hypothetical protein